MDYNHLTINGDIYENVVVFCTICNKVKYFDTTLQEVFVFAKIHQHSLELEGAKWEDLVGRIISYGLWQSMDLVA